jgi:hypothetical protein
VRPPAPHVEVAELVVLVAVVEVSAVTLAEKIAQRQ